MAEAEFRAPYPKYLDWLDGIGLVAQRRQIEEFRMPADTADREPGWGSGDRGIR